MAEFTDNSYGDVLSQLNASIDKVNTQSQLNGEMARTQIQILESINNNLVAALRGSQSAAGDSVFGKNGRFGSTYDSFTRRSNFDRGGGSLGSFSDELEKQLMEGFLGSGFKDDVQSIFKDFAKELGVSVEDLPGKLGEELGKRAMNSFKNTRLGKSVTDYTQKSREKLGNEIRTRGKSWLDSGKLFGNAGQGAKQGVKGIGSAFKNGPAAGFMEMGKVAGQGVKALGGLAAAAGPAAIGLVALELISGQLKKIFDSLVKVAEKAKDAMFREQKSRMEYAKMAQERLKKDINTIIEEPFTILKKAAEEVYSAWDQNVRVINATQGYNKADLQDLMSSFAQRLRDEGLTNVLSGTTIVDSLTKVLEAGLSGKVAEEFAYEAAKLNAAVPTQDFFSFASSYASVAANAIKDGKSQSEAIKLANQSLHDFTNDVVYASRELSGGFTTGLKDATSLYEQAVKIQQASRTGDINTIAGVLTSTSAIVGSIAPDLASSLVDAIYKAATGGNSSDIVALRSLAGINAGNTDFLRAFASDPQKIISNMFSGLANLYNQSPDAYMEKAEGYAQLFGLSAEAFQRVDFNYLAKAISQMNVNSNSLERNLELLKSGETTTTAEQLKMQQINQYMLEEGLAYVIDNDAARAIQQHMWDEQLAQQMMETEYGVEIRGAAMEALATIQNAIENIVGFLTHPIRHVASKLGNLKQSRDETKGLEADIAEVLRLGKVGQGNARDLHNLTTRGVNLGLTKQLVELLGGKSSYAAVHDNLNALQRFGKSEIPGLLPNSNNWFDDVTKAHSSGSNGAATGAQAPSSQYRWSVVGKSTASAASAVANLLGSSTGKLTSNITKSVGNSIKNSAVSMIESMVEDDYMNKFIAEGKTYEDWVASGKFKNQEAFSTAVTQAGYNENDLRAYFQSKETERAIIEETVRLDREKLFQETGTEFWQTRFWEEYYTPLTEMLTENFTKIHTWHDTFYEYFTETFDPKWQDNYDLFVKGWTDDRNRWENHWKAYSRYYLEHYIYNNGTSQLLTTRLAEVQKKEKAKKGDVVNALSEYLTANNWNLEDLKDPQIQTNALLSQILVVINAIMNQNNKTAGTLNFADTIQALAKGIT